MVIIVFAVPSLVSLYLLAAVPRAYSNRDKMSELRRDSLSLTQTFFDFFLDYNPSANTNGAHISSQNKIASRLVLVTGRQ